MTTVLTAAFGGTAETPGAGFSAGDFYAGVINVLLVLAVVIGLLVLFIRFLAAKTSRWTAGRRLRVLAGVQLGQNKSLQVVEVADAVYIVGVGENVTLIDRIDDPDKVRALLEALSAQTGGGAPSVESAAALLRKLRERTSGRAPAEDGETGAASFRELLAERLNAAGTGRRRKNNGTEEEER